jgi:phosphomannomutase
MAILALREVTRVRALSGESEIHVLHNLIASRAVTETIERAGAVAVRTRVGNSALRDAMRETGAVVGGEHSAHYYFRDFWGADSGMLAAMHLLAELGSTTSPLSELARRLSPYAQSGEIDCTVDDIPAAYHRIVTEFAGESLDELDGLTVSGATGDAFWWFNVRPSATQPLLRLNVEAGTAELMAAIRDRALALIRA